MVGLLSYVEVLRKYKNDKNDDGKQSLRNDSKLEVVNEI